MKPFQLTLQSVLILRQRREQEANESYAHALLERTKSLEQCLAAERALSTAQGEWQQQIREGCTAGEMVLYALNCQRLTRVREEKAGLLAEAERKVHAKLKNMLLARRDREAVDKFRERQKLVHNRALIREEQKFLDYLAQRRTETELTSSLNGRRL